MTVIVRFTKPVEAGIHRTRGLEEGGRRGEEERSRLYRRGMVMVGDGIGRERRVRRVRKENGREGWKGVSKKDVDGRVWKRDEERTNGRKRENGKEGRG